ncbi:MAG: transporter [Rhodocyclaceae bacterium]|nr:transporter [Rhodocyclaceae bacterium]
MPFASPAPTRRRWPLAVAASLSLCAAGAQAGDLRNFISDLYGGDGITLDRFGQFPHDAHFTESSLVALNGLGDGIASGLGALAFNSTVSSFVYDVQQGIPVRNTESLGPLVAERANTIGEGRVNLGVSYTRARFTKFEGDDLDSLTVRLPHIDANGDGVLGPPPDVFAFEFDEVQVDIDAEVRQQILSFYASYGIRSNWDVGVIVPIVETKVEARAVATIIDNGGGDDFHRFGEFGDAATDSTGGTATGLGDIVVRSKYAFEKAGGGAPEMAVVGQLTVPSGDEDDLLGTGDWAGMGMFVASRKYGAITPHVNLGYEHSSDSDRSNLRYLFGFDAQPGGSKNFTAAVDLLGRYYPNESDDRDHLIDVAIGAKWDAFGNAPLSANVILPLNDDEGLRANVIWSVGIDYTF